MLFRSFETESDGSIINCQYVLNDNLDIVRSYYSHINKQNINEQVSISQSEEARLLKIVQTEIDGFMKKNVSDFVWLRLSTCSYQ